VEEVNESIKIINIKNKINKIKTKINIKE